MGRLEYRNYVFETEAGLSFEDFGWYSQETGERPPPVWGRLGGGGGGRGGTKPNMYAFHVFFLLDGVQVVNLVHSHVYVLFKPIVLCFPRHRLRTDC